MKISPHKIQNIPMAEASKSTANATNPKENLVDWCETLYIVFIRPVYKVHPAGWVYRCFERASIRVKLFQIYIYIEQLDVLAEYEEKNSMLASRV